MQISVIIVSYNVRHYLEQCLRSLVKALDGLSAEVIVFDNHSRDGSVECLSRLFPHVCFISSSHNLGFARANNRAIEQSCGRYVLLLNPDTIVGEGVLREAVAFMDSHPKAGGAGVRMMKADGSDAMESRRGVPTPLTAFCKMSGLCSHFPTSHTFGKYYMGWLPWDSPERIEVTSGAFCLLRRTAIDGLKGPLDEDFFMYGEDIDLSYRLLKNGWENWYLPLRILHYKGESTEKSSFRYVHVFYEAMLIFFRKHYSHISKIFYLPIQTAIYAKATASLLSMLWRKARQTLGFVSPNRSDEALYIFYVRPENMSRCQKLARSKGLWAEFHDANKNAAITPPKKTRKGQRVYIAYDTTAYSFEEMFRQMAAMPEHNALMATYYPDQDKVITDADIISQ